METKKVTPWGQKKREPRILASYAGCRQAHLIQQQVHQSSRHIAMNLQQPRSPGLEYWRHSHKREQELQALCIFRKEKEVSVSFVNCFKG